MWHKVSYVCFQLCHNVHWNISIMNMSRFSHGIKVLINCPTIVTIQAKKLFKEWSHWIQKGLNLGPFDHQPSALPSELPDFRCNLVFFNIYVLLCWALHAQILWNQPHLVTLYLMAITIFHRHHLFFLPQNSAVGNTHAHAHTHTHTHTSNQFFAMLANQKLFTGVPC